eukprot:TRINITY_DN3764_c0_g1_i2.p1 TRINITY_DN3764_c0_g1~~TRINITY_DN3764_c0_g1_i2.p1  ORF type:complete len:155 (+),score=54.26 TRINITY_DN3764_c0_g1_i2:112-576(+)
MSTLSYAQGKADKDWGEKLAEGVYIMNRKRKPAVDNSQLLLGRGDIRLYPDEIKRLQDVRQKLAETNRELEECLVEDPDEEEYRVAIRENVDVMASMAKQIKDMEDELVAKGYGSLVDRPAERPANMHLLQEDQEFEQAAGEAADENEPDTIVL